MFKSRQHFKILLSLAALVLALAIWLEIADPTQDGQVVPDRVRTVPTLTALHPVAEQTSQPDAWLSQILLRPLFSPDRRPVGDAARSVPGLPRLTGLVITESKQVAIFAAQPPASQPMLLEAGSHIGPYDVQEIGAFGVRITGPKGTIVIHPTFDVSPPPVQAIAVPTRPVRPKQ